MVWQAKILDIDRHWSEEKAYAMLRAMLQWENANGKQLLNLREINEEIYQRWQSVCM